MISRDLAAALKDPDAVKELDLSGTGLSEVPPTISKLKNLEILRLDRNALTALPAAIGKLKLLRELHAAHNRITSENIDRSIWFFKDLEVLNLHGNQLHWIDDMGTYQKRDFAVYLAGNPLDVKKCADDYPEWKHALHMLPLATYGKNHLRVFSMDIDRIKFPLAKPNTHYEPPFEHVQTIQLYGRAPKANELADLKKQFPNATVEACGDAADGPKIVAMAKPEAKPAKTAKPAAKAKKR